MVPANCHDTEGKAKMILWCVSSLWELTWVVATAIPNFLQIEYGHRDPTSLKTPNSVLLVLKSRRSREEYAKAGNGLAIQCVGSHYVAVCSSYIH